MDYGKTYCKSERKCVKHFKRLRSGERQGITFQINVGEELVFTFPRDRVINKERNI